MGKTRVGQIVRESVGTNNQGTGMNAHDDLKQLTDKYMVYCKKVRALASALQKHIAILTEYNQSRSNVSKGEYTERKGEDDL